MRKSGILKTYKATIYACYVGYVTQAIVNNLAPLLFLTFQRQFDVSLQKIGLLITFNFGTQLIVDFLAAKYVDRIGYRLSVMVAHAAATAGLVGMCVFPYLLPSPYLGLLLAVLLNAIGGGIIEVLVSPIVEAVPSDVSHAKDKAMSLLHSFYCFGHVGVVLISTLLFWVLGIDNWQFLPLLFALVPLVNFFIFAKVPINTLVEDGQPLPVRKLLSMKLFWILALLMLCSAASELAMSQWASYFAESSLGVSKTMGDLLGPCAFALLMGFTRAYYGKSGAKLNLERFIVGSAVLCLCCYLVAVFAPVPILGMIGCAVCGCSVGIMWPGTFSIAVRECPQGGIAMFGLLALAGDAGAMVGPGLVSLVSGALPQIGLKAGLFAAIVFPIALIIGMLGRMRKKRAA